MGPRANLTVVFDCCIAVYDGVITYDRVDMHHSARKYQHTSANLSAGVNICSGMYN
jgi:hypothetical protein